MQCTIADVVRRLDRMETKLATIDTKLDTLVGKADDIEASCGHMDRHIDFIHGVYRTVRSPLDYVCQRLAPARISRLPEIRE